MMDAEGARAAAVDGAEEAARAAADGDPYLCRYLTDLANTYARTGRPADAVDPLDRAAELPGVPVGERADAAITWAGLAAAHAQWYRARAFHGRAERIRADLDSATRSTAPWPAETDALVSLVREAVC